MTGGPTSKAARGKRRRQREKDASDGGGIDRAAIYDRDNGRCHLCKRRVPVEDFTLDHVVALAAGGAHTEANLRVAHRDCNSAKGARTEEERAKRPGLRRTKPLRPGTFRRVS